MLSITLERRLAPIALITVTAGTLACSDTPSSPTPNSPTAVDAQAAMGPKVGEGHIVYSDGVYSSDIFAYDVATKTTTRISNDFYVDIDPHVSADGKRVVWTRLVGPSGNDLFMANLDGTKLERVTPAPIKNAGKPRFTPDVKRLLMNAFDELTQTNHLFTYDLRNGQLTSFGQSTQVAGESAYSPDGKWLVFIGFNGVRNVPLITNAAGTPVQEIENGCPGSGNCTHVVWSPDGKMLAVGTSSNEIYLHSMVTHTSDLFTTNARFPMWSPDGARVGYYRPGAPGGFFGFYARAVNGSEPEQQLKLTGSSILGAVWSK